MKETTKVLTALAAAVIVGLGVNAMIGGNNENGDSSSIFTAAQAQTAQTTSAAFGNPVDLTAAAEKSVHAVVQIKSTINSRTTTVQQYDPFSDFFDFFGSPYGGGNSRNRSREREVQTPKREGLGSGVIISKDGYIVTNNHVVDGSDELTVTLHDRREFKARLIGQDASTDLALIKIDSKDLPILTVANSDNIKVGEWVLAVGNPLGLSSTVTAGIVSAKGRGSLGMSGNSGVESFIQTDAAINQGNSGGALVNARGELIGINAAIISQTGSYSGYGFAIPANIMTKVIDDLKTYGVVQRALLGIQGGNNSEALLKEKDLGMREGVYIDDVTSGGSADDAGLKKGDVITAIDGKSIATMAELQETIIKHKPGDKITVTYYRDKKKQDVKVTLKNAQGTTKVVKNVDMDILGAAFKEISDEAKSRLGVRYGIEVSAVRDGAMKDAGIEKGFVIIMANDQVVNSTEDLEKSFKAAIGSANPALWITAYNNLGQKKFFAVDLTQEKK